MSRIEEGARRGAERAIKAHLDNRCTEHIKRTEALEEAVFGDHEEHCGLLERVDAVERLLARWEDDSRWLKRAVISALIIAIVSVLTKMA